MIVRIPSPALASRIAVMEMQREVGRGWVWPTPRTGPDLAARRHAGDLADVAEELKGARQ